MTYDDAYIEQWGEVYTASPRLQRYCSFERFLARPLAIIDGIGEQPLAAQLAVRWRVAHLMQTERRPV